MEDYKTDFILILAGYGLEMEMFLRSNPGLPSRFPITVAFDDYSEDELLSIAKQQIGQREYRLTTDAEIRLREHLRHVTTISGQSFANARMVRNLMEKSIRLQAVRLVQKSSITRDELMNLFPEDLGFTGERL